MNDEFPNVTLPWNKLPQSPFSETHPLLLNDPIFIMKPVSANNTARKVGCFLACMTIIFLIFFYLFFKFETERAI